MCMNYLYSIWKTRHLLVKFLILSTIIILTSKGIYAQKEYKFEHINISEGLSQKYVQSIFCDHKGFLWFGTWGGLNRYDGKQFKVFTVNASQRNSLTNNRVIDIWQDIQDKLWVKTNDGYNHYFVEETYEFITFPYYLKSLEERNSTITSFTENDNGKVLLGSSNSGLYYLTYNAQNGRYDERQFLNRGVSSISHNTISFIMFDQDNEIWIGTKKGLNNISPEELSKESPSFANYWLDYEFTCSADLDSILIFGTKRNGIKIFERRFRKFDTYPEQFQRFSDKDITLIQTAGDEKLVIGTTKNGLHVYDIKSNSLDASLLKNKTIRRAYKDDFGDLWINTEEFGIYRLDKKLHSLNYYKLTDDEIKNLVDDERQNIFEDSRSNLWIGIHGGGLAKYDRKKDEFYFYKNDPNDESSISSDNVYCIEEDNSGILWAGTGVPNGGVNKIQPINEAFRQIRIESIEISGKENVVRAVLIDNNNHTWVGTKGGEILILDQQYEIAQRFKALPLLKGNNEAHNAYTMLQDSDGFIWIGTKGGGIYVTSTPIYNSSTKYQDIQFVHYTHDPDIDSSLNSNMIYSIYEDSKEQIWIGSHKGGLALVTGRDNTRLSCYVYDITNSEISSNKVRNLYEDNQHRLWIATAFGLNYINLNTLDKSNPEIESTLFDPSRPNSISYNDVVHIFQDSNDTLWFSTLGGGVNKLISDNPEKMQFQYLTTKEGLVNDVVYTILEDNNKRLWFSTDRGLSSYDANTNTFENFDESNNLPIDVFNENTCEISRNGELIYGSNEGLIIVDPNKIKRVEFRPNIVFTNFQLFNKDIDILDPASPVKQDIETLKKIELSHYQSSFSIEYAALSYFDPSKNKYAFKLDNFDEQWNEVGNQNKATYTNLAPGNYVFKVKAANWNSDWSNNERRIDIIISPPWWETTGMYIVYFAVFVLIFEIIRRSYVRYHQLQNDLKVEKRVNDIKLQFFTNISHEIRTPLTLILGPIHDILEIKNLPKNLTDKMHLIEKNGKRMLRLVNQLLDFRKIQKNKMQLQAHQTELVPFVQSIIENFDLIATQKQIKIQFQSNVGDLQVWVDSKKFDSVIFNILSNALKFSPKNGTVLVQIDKTKDQYVDISISDQGKGIRQSKINQIFERYTPLSEQNDEFGSSGIGLAYSYEIMKLHKGDIVVKSEEGNGSEFIIRVLLGNTHFGTIDNATNEIDEAHISADTEVLLEYDDIKEEVIEGQTKETRYNILIIEDNNDILSYLKSNLQSEFSVSTASNGKEGLKVIEENQPDIVITDVMMPEMDGIEFTKRIKDSIETSHIPIIMLTAKSSIENQIEGIESGAESYILKPFSITYVKAVIANLIKQRTTLQTKYLKEDTLDQLLDEVVITSKDEQFLEDVNTIIKDNYSDPAFNIEKLVEMSYASRTVFYNKIKSLTGLSPIDFLRQKRLNIAAKLIATSDLNVSEIAYSIGFNDTKYFSKKFKSFFGMTPTEYKNQHNQVEQK